MTAAQPSDNLSKFAETLAISLGHRAKCPRGCPLLARAVVVLNTGRAPMPAPGFGSLGFDCKLQAPPDGYVSTLRECGSRAALT